MDNWKELEILQDEYQRLNLHKTVDYEKFYLYSIIAHSTAIEGSTLTELDTEILLDKGLTAKGKPLKDHLMNQDLSNAYKYAVEKATSKTPVTPEFLCELNSIVMNSTGALFHNVFGDCDGTKGDFRLHSVTSGIGGKSYVNFQKIPRLVDQFCHTISKRLSSNTLKDIYDLSFDAHLNLTIIHPWSDGNGRTSRLLMNYIQFYHHVLPVKIHNENKLDYIQALRASEEKKNPIPFREFMYQEHIQTLKEEIEKHKKSKKMGFSLIF